LAPAEGQTPAAAPPETQNPAPAGTETPAPGNSSAMLPTRANSGLLTVWVPANAKVYINGKETVTQGIRRRYVSHGLQQGLTYKYDVRAEFARNGKLAHEEKTVYLTAGSSDGVAFGFNAPVSNQVATTATQP